MEIVYDPLRMEDSEEFFSLAGDERVAATMRFDCPHTKEESDRILADYLVRGNRSFALRWEPKGRLWGVFAFRQASEPESADLSQMLLPEQWGHGLGRQVLGEMVELAKEKKWYHFLEGYILQTNSASRRMAERVGFQEIRRHRFPGMTEDLIVYHLSLSPA